MGGDAAGVHAEHLATLLQALVDGGSETRQQHFAFPQTVDVDRKSSQVLRENELHSAHTQQSIYEQRFKLKRKVMRELEWNITTMPQFRTVEITTIQV